MLKGIDITLYSKTQTGEDRFHDPIYEETPVTVHNVLVGEPSAEEITTELQLTGRMQRWSSSARPSAPAAALCRASRA